MSGWVDQYADERVLKQTQEDLRLMRQLHAEARVSEELPCFIDSFLAELRASCDKLTLRGELRIRASISDSTDPDIESRWRVQVARLGVVPDFTYTDVLHANGKFEIRCVRPDLRTYSLHFAVNENAVSVYPERNPELLMNPERLARYIIEPMLREL